MSVRALIYIILMAVLLVLSAFFSISDMAYSAVPLSRLEKKAKKSKAHAKAYQYASHYDKTIATILFGNSVANILMSSLGAALALQEPFKANSELSATIIEVVVLLLILTFGEILPKVIGKVYSYRVCLIVAYPIRFFELFFFPIVKVSSAFASWVTRPFKKKKGEDDVLSDEELAEMVNTIEEEGIIDEGQKEMLQNSIEFLETRAYHIMTPRVKIESIDYATNLMKYIETYGMFKHSRIIVYRKSLDDIVGYIPLKTLQRALLNRKSISVDMLMLPIISVPRTMELSSILPLMKQSHHHVVVVKDEYGGTEGILTMEDILEEIVGELWDESEPISPNVKKSEKRNQYFVKGSMNIEEFFSYFKMDEEGIEDGYETLSGWINEKLGAFGKVGDEFDYKRITVRVIKASSFVVEEALVIYHPRRKIN